MWVLSLFKYGMMIIVFSADNDGYFKSVQYTPAELRSLFAVSISHANDVLRKSFINTHFH